MSIDAEKVSITVRIQIQIFLILDISHNYIGRFWNTFSPLVIWQIVLSKTRPRQYLSPHISPCVVTVTVTPARGSAYVPSSSAKGSLCPHPEVICCNSWDQVTEENTASCSSGGLSQFLDTMTWGRPRSLGGHPKALVHILGWIPGWQAELACQPCKCIILKVDPLTHGFHTP